MLNWVEVDGEAIRHNLAEFRRRIGPGVRLGAVVKSNAYGHGIREVARIAGESGVDWLCVNNVEEGTLLREIGKAARVLVMGYVSPADLPALVAHRLTPVIYDDERIGALEAAAAAADRAFPVHIKVETGTHRQGVAMDRLVEFADRIEESPHLELEGLSTHFANIEDTTDHSFAESQVANYRQALESLRAAGHPVPLRHVACSAATLLFPHTHLDLVRLGISLYGLWPSRETRISSRELEAPAPDLRPALTWKSRVAQVKPVPEADYVGYGCTYRTTRPSTIAVLPVGYHEGYDRGFSGVGHVLIGGKRAPVRGRVCMNMTLVDVTDIPGVSAGDEVVLLGSQRDERLTAEQLAGWCGTIAYEIVSRIHPGLPRVLIDAT